jgi:hypothetical protein
MTTDTRTEAVERLIAERDAARIEGARLALEAAAGAAETYWKTIDAHPSSITAAVGVCHAAAIRAIDPAQIVKGTE